MAHAVELREIAWSDWSFRPCEKHFNRFVRYEINLLVSRASIRCKGHQFLILPGGPLEDRFLQCVQRQAQLGGADWAWRSSLHVVARAMPAPSLLGDVKNNATGSPLRYLKSGLPLGG